MPELITPTTRLRDAWLDAHDEWGPGQHEDGFGLAPSDDVRSPAGFADWVARLAAESAYTTYRWIVEDDRVLGGIALRHRSDDYVRWAGHVGYGIRPTARGAGWPRGHWAGCSTRHERWAWIGCWSCARPTTSPRSRRSSTTAAYSKASGTPSSARHGATGSHSTRQMGREIGDDVHRVG